MKYVYYAIPAVACLLMMSTALAQDSPLRPVAKTNWNIIKQQVDAATNKATNVHTSLDGLRGRATTLEGQATGFETRLSTVDPRIEEHEGRLDDQEMHILDIQSEFAGLQGMKNYSKAIVISTSTPMANIMVCSSTQKFLINGICKDPDVNGGGTGTTPGTGTGTGTGTSPGPGAATVTSFVLGDDCSSLPCFPNNPTADRACVKFGYVESTTYTPKTMNIGCGDTYKRNKWDGSSWVLMKSVNDTGNKCNKSMSDNYIINVTCKK